MKLTKFSNALHKLRVVEQKLVKDFEDRTGFSLTRYEILTYLREHGDSLSVDISSYLSLDPAAITRHIKILEEKNYVTKSRSAKNGREVIISLTDFAIGELNSCREKNQGQDLELSLPFEEQDLDDLIKILDKFESKLNN